MILIKDRHCHSILCSSFLYLPGKYDTYKGSTLGLHTIVFFLCNLGNMILIKDRHRVKIIPLFFLGILGNMILIKDRHMIQYQNYLILILLGKYDTYRIALLNTRNSILFFMLYFCFTG